MYGDKSELSDVMLHCMAELCLEPHCAKAEVGVCCEIPGRLLPGAALTRGAERKVLVTTTVSSTGEQRK